MADQDNRYDVERSRPGSGVRPAGRGRDAGIPSRAGGARGRSRPGQRGADPPTHVGDRPVRAHDLARRPGAALPAGEADRRRRGRAPRRSPRLHRGRAAHARPRCRPRARSRPRRRSPSAAVDPDRRRPLRPDPPSTAWTVAPWPAAGSPPGPRPPPLPRSSCASSGAPWPSSPAARSCSAGTRRPRRCRRPRRPGDSATVSKSHSSCPTTAPRPRSRTRLGQRVRTRSRRRPRPAGRRRLRDRAPRRPRAARGLRLRRRGGCESESTSVASSAGGPSGMDLSETTRLRLSVVSVVALVTTFVFFASQAEGNVVPDPTPRRRHLGDQRGTRAVGRTNAEIATVDTKLAAGSNDFDVLQSGTTWSLRTADPVDSTAIDPARSTLVPGPGTPVGSARSASGAAPPHSSTPTPASCSWSRRPRRGRAGARPAARRARGTIVDGTHRWSSGRRIGPRPRARERGGQNFDATAPRSVPPTSVAPAGSDTVLTTVGDRPAVLDGDRCGLPGRDPVTIDVGRGQLAVQEPGPDTGAGARRQRRSCRPGRVRRRRRDLFDGGTGAPAPPVQARRLRLRRLGDDPSYAQVCAGADPV